MQISFLPTRLKIISRFNPGQMFTDESQTQIAGVLRPLTAKAGIILKTVL